MIDPQKLPLIKRYLLATFRKSCYVKGLKRSMCGGEYSPRSENDLITDSLYLTALFLEDRDYLHKLEPLSQHFIAHVISTYKKLEIDDARTKTASAMLHCIGHFTGIEDKFFAGASREYLARRLVAEALYLYFLNTKEEAKFDIYDVVIFNDLSRGIELPKLTDRQLAKEQQNSMSLRKHKAAIMSEHLASQNISDADLRLLLMRFIDHNLEFDALSLQPEYSKRLCTDQRRLDSFKVLDAEAKKFGFCALPTEFHRAGEKGTYSAGRKPK